MSQRWDIRKPTQADLVAIKTLCDDHRIELGFVMRPSLVKAIDDRELFVAYSENMLTGLVHYHHRRDGQTTLYHIVVAPTQRSVGLGKALVEALRTECEAHKMKTILLKCPSGLAANDFYARIGFKHTLTEVGKIRQLQIWEMVLIT